MTVGEWGGGTCRRPAADKEDVRSIRSNLISFPVHRYIKDSVAVRLLSVLLSQLRKNILPQLECLLFTFLGRS